MAKGRIPNKPKLHKYKSGLDRQIQHGMERHRLYKIHDNMLSRCYKANDVGYKNYGARGIAVCEEWRIDRRKFFAWSFDNGYESHLQIDRIDNDEGYSPDNCRWVSRVENANNRRNNRWIEWQGRRQTVSQWAREIGIREKDIHARMGRGWSVGEILTIPMLKPGQRRRSWGS